MHGDGDLPRITVEWSLLGPGVEATFDVVRFSPGVEVPQRIVINTVARRPGLALLFELGHLLDHQTLGERGKFASVGHPRLASWRDAILASRSFGELTKNLTANPHGALSRHLAYLLQLEELWERSYAQYVATRSGDPVLRAELDERRRQLGSFSIPYQWDDDDFEPVAGSIDVLFGELGWLI